MIKDNIKKKLDYNNLRIFIIIFLIIISIVFIFILLESKKISKIIDYQKDQENYSNTFYGSFLPLRNWNISYPEINSSSALVALISDKNKLLFEKDSDKKVPIASITKLMTALITLDEYSLNDEVIITENAFLKDYMRPVPLYPGEKYNVENLLYLSLIESNNTAAQSLADGKDSFINKMNHKAKSLGMNSTFFINPTGLDDETLNYSTTKDILILIQHLIEYPLVWEILSNSEYTARKYDGSIKYKAINTNKLLNERPGMVGGKTGTTIKSGQCFVTLLERSEGHILTVVLGSNNRLSETVKLLDWIDIAYYWKKI
jgi:serine-type D-Ala-D-Ala carboxypeptidase (penicillin-binding protein 5/6)